MEELSHLANKTYNVTGFVKPNTGVDIIIDCAQIEIGKLTRKDVVVLWCGANDIDNNASGKTLTQKVNFIRQNQETNVVLITSPYRYVVCKRTHLNEEIRSYNRKVSKLCKVCRNVQLLNVFN